MNRFLQPSTERVSVWWSGQIACCLCLYTVDKRSEFYHTSSHVDCTVWCKIRELKAEETLQKFRKHVCQSSSRTNTAWSWKKKTSVCSLCHHRLFMGWKISWPSLESASSENFALHLALALFLQLLSWSVHREKCSNFSTTHWFHSACTSVSIFTIKVDNCMFLYSCFLVVITSNLWVHIGSLSISGLQSLHQIQHRLHHFHLVVECWIHG